MGQSRSMGRLAEGPWIVMGDFDNVTTPVEKHNGVEVTLYEIRDMVTCLITLELVDMPSIGYFFTWTNNIVWSKLDKALVNQEWMQVYFSRQANFLPPSYLSDHSLCVVFIFEPEAPKKL